MRQVNLEELTEAADMAYDAYSIVSSQYNKIDALLTDAEEDINNYIYLRNKIKETENFILEDDILYSLERIYDFLDKTPVKSL